MVAGLGVFGALGLTAATEAGSAGPATADVTATVERRSFDFYRRNVEPLFARPRGYPDRGESAACVMCHTWQTSLRFQLEDMTETPDGWVWTPAQSTLNYGVVTQLVNASDPSSSKLLRKPLATQAGGEGHTGGTYWESTDDPEYQAVLDWIEMLPPEQFTPGPEPTLDFEFYRTCVQRGLPDAALRRAHVPGVPRRRLHGLRAASRERNGLDRGGGAPGLRGDSARDSTGRSRAEPLAAQAPPPRWGWLLHAQRRAAMGVAGRSGVADARRGGTGRAVG
jgi:hypothetical protein